MVASVECQSRIREVCVFARGAVVRRTVELPADLPESEVDVVVSGITAQALGGSARAAVAGDRSIVYVRAELSSPHRAALGPATEKVRELERERERIELAKTHLTARRERLGGVRPEPRFDRVHRRIDPKRRMDDALAVSSLLDGLTAELDRELADLDDALEEVMRKWETARLEAEQANAGALEGPVRDSMTIAVRLSAGPRPASLEVSYTVLAARWWPAYSARFKSAATEPVAEWTLDALVAQATGEDWNGVDLALTTVDLVQNAELPELSSFRLGRAQPKPKRAFRPMPEGLDQMFAGYDQALNAFRPAPLPPLARRKAPRREAVAVGGAAAVKGMRQAPPPPPRAPAPSSKMRAAEVSSSVSAPMPAPPPMAMAAEMAFGAPQGMVAPGSTTTLFEDDETTDALRLASITIAPSDDWLDFDSLAVADMDDRRQRGRLRMARVRHDQGKVAEPAARIEQLPAPPMSLDPRELSRRGHQLRYQSDAPVTVASEGVVHRVAVTKAEGEAARKLLAVPRESADVYREAVQRNPFSSALLPGPVDVFVDGSLLTTSTIDFVGAGGTVRLGLGVEERVRIARNVRVEEESTGFLGGKTAVLHAVEIDVSSSLGHPVSVVVYDRVPVTEDKDVEIELTSARPRPDHYDQADRAAPIRGGIAFSLELAPNQKDRIEFRYRIVFPAKNELTGGNRRE
jgi:hypothetical protein